jgi:hypothetical protein
MHPGELFGLARAGLHILDPCPALPCPAHTRVRALAHLRVHAQKEASCIGQRRLVPKPDTGYSGTDHRDLGPAVLG